MTPTEVYRALSHLVELGGLVRTSRGRYAINPDVAWSGSLAKRESASIELLPLTNFSLFPLPIYLPSAIA